MSPKLHKLCACKFIYKPRLSKRTTVRKFFLTLPIQLITREVSRFKVIRLLKFSLKKDYEYPK